MMGDSFRHASRSREAPVPSCNNLRNHSLTVVSRKLLLSRARKQADSYANFRNLVPAVFALF